MDIGHGMGSLSFEVAGQMLAQGFRPDSISTDLHAYSYPHPVHDLPTTLSKFMALGLSLTDVIRAATCAPAAILGLQEQIGSLRVGMKADVAVFSLEEGAFEFVDSYGNAIPGTRRLVNTATIKDGRVWQA